MQGKTGHIDAPMKSISIYRTIRLTGLICCLLTPAFSARAMSDVGEKPNFVIIFTDDHGYQDIGEQNNLIDQYPEKARELKKLLEEFKQDLDHG